MSRDAPQAALGIQNQPMFEHGMRQVLDIVGDHVTSAFDRGVGLRCSEQGDRGAGTRPQGKVRRVARSPDEPQDVFPHLLMDVDFAHGGLHAEYGGGVRHGLKRFEGASTADPFEHFALGDDTGIADRESNHEAVELGLGQRKGAFVLHRVLRGEDDKGQTQLMSHAVDRDLSLGHGFEQRRLGARGGPVDFVCEHYIGKNRPWSKFELLRLLIEDGYTADIGRQEVGRTLDATEAASARNGQGSHHHGLGHTGNVFEEDVAAGHISGECGLDDRRLAVYDLFDIRDDSLDRVAEFAHLITPYSQG